MAETKVTYQTLLQKSYEAMTVYEKFRSGYPEKFETHLCKGDKCISCQNFKAFKFNVKYTLEEIEHSQSGPWCRYIMYRDYYQYNVNHVGTGFFGEDLARLKEMNKHVMTYEISSSPTEKDDSFLLSFFAPRSLADKICRDFKEKYYYFIMDQDKKLLEVHESKRPESFITQLQTLLKSHPESINLFDFPEKWKDEMKPLFEGPDPLVLVCLVDENQEKRDLFPVLCKYFSDMKA